MSDEFAEVVSLVEKAQEKGKFNLAKAVKGLSYPTDSVKVYLDIDSAYKLNSVNDLIMQTGDLEELKPLEAQAKELADKVLASKVVFNMRGIDQKQIEAIEASIKEDKETASDEWWVAYTCALIAANIVSVEDAEGNIDDHLFTYEDVVELRGTMPAEGWNKIMSTMQKLTLATGYFQGLTDAGFLQKS